MNAYKWTLLGVLVLNAALVILKVGKPSKPTTPGVALGVCIFNGVLAVAVVLA